MKKTSFILAILSSSIGFLAILLFVFTYLFWSYLAPFFSAPDYCLKYGPVIPWCDLVFIFGVFLFSVLQLFSFKVKNTWLDIIIAFFTAIIVPSLASVLNHLQFYIVYGYEDVGFGFVDTVLISLNITHSMFASSHNLSYLALAIILLNCGISISAKKIYRQ